MTGSVDVLAPLIFFDEGAASMDANGAENEETRIEVGSGGG